MRIAETAEKNALAELTIRINCLDGVHWRACIDDTSGNELWALVSTCVQEVWDCSQRELQRRAAKAVERLQAQDRRENPGLFDYWRRVEDATNKHRQTLDPDSPRVW